MKSGPLRLNASTGGGAPFPRRLEITRRTSRLVKSGFCSDPESANSRSMIFWVTMNQL